MGVQVSQSLERFLAGFHGKDRGCDDNNTCVAIPRKVPRRFPRANVKRNSRSNLHVAIPRKVPRRFPPHAWPPFAFVEVIVAIPRKVPRRFPLFGLVSGRDAARDVAIPRKVPRRFPPPWQSWTASMWLLSRNPSKGSSPVSTEINWREPAGASGSRNPSKGSSPVSTGNVCVQARQCRGCRNPSKGSSPVSTPADLAADAAARCVAIPRKVPRRFPPCLYGAVSTRVEVSQSLERFLAGFHRMSRARPSRPRTTCRNPSKGSSPVSTPPLPSPCGSVSWKAISANLPRLGLGEGQDRRGQNRTNLGNPLISKSFDAFRGLR